MGEYMEMQGKVVAVGAGETNNDLVNWLIYTKEAVVSVSLDFRIQQFNLVAEKIFDRNEYDVIGKDYLKLCAYVGVASPFPGDVSQILSGQPLVDVEIPFNNKPLIFSWTILRILNYKHIPSGFMLIGHDVTKLRQAEATIVRMSIGEC